MLKERLVTGLLLAGLILLTLLVFPLGLAFVLGLLVMGLCADEWLKLSGYEDPASRCVYALLVMVVCAVLGSGLLGVDFWLGVGAGLWLVLGAWLLSADHSASAASRCRPRLTVAFLGVFVLAMAFYAMVWLRQSAGGAWLLLYVIGIPVVTDTAAYFSGKRFGRVKLAPSISPGKTREGVVGGLLGAMLYAAVLGAWIGQGLSLPLLMLLTVLTASVSVFGDLFESALKRRSHLKDSGALLPGHGGVLDRFDSLLAAAPIFAALFALAS